MKLLKEKVNPLNEINDKFLAKTLEATKILHDRISDLIEGKLDKEGLKGVILCEKECDKLKEEYIKILFKDKKALPFLVEDRYKIITMVDHMTGKNELLARFIRAFPFGIYDDIKEQLIEFNGLYHECIKDLIDCVILMETNFDEAFEKTFEIELDRRTAKKMKYRMFDKLYQKKDNMLQIYLTSKLIAYTYDVVDAAEGISDYLRGLIIKYPSK